MKPQEPMQLKNPPAVAFDRTSVFSLELSREGVLLRLESASIRDFLAVEDLVLKVPFVKYPFDYTAGPRALQSMLTELCHISICIKLQSFVSLLHSGELTVEKVVGARNLIVIRGIFNSVPFTLRCYIMPGDREFDVHVRLREPRAYGPVRSDVIPALLGKLIPPYFGRLDGPSIGLRILKPTLRALLAPMGYKVPDTRDATLMGYEVAGDRIRLTFGPNGPKCSYSDKEDTYKFYEMGVGTPRMWPEVLARAVMDSEERPELVAPNLAGLIVASSMGEDSVLEMFASRTIFALNQPEDAEDLVLAARLVSAVVERLQPERALSLLRELQTRCPEEPTVLLAIARTLERLGHREDALTTWLRGLALTDEEETLVHQIEVMDSSGLCVRPFLDAVMNTPSLPAAMRHRALLELAAREVMDEYSRDQGRERLKRYLEIQPDDQDAIELFVSTCITDGEVAEAVDLLCRAARRGIQKVSYLLQASRLLLERFGLKHRAASLLEEAFFADPLRTDIAEELDRVLEGIGAHSRRFQLAEKRLVLARETSRRLPLLRTAVCSAIDAGFPEKARAYAHEWVQLEPASTEALELATIVFISANDKEALEGIMHDLCDIYGNSLESLIESLELKVAEDPFDALARRRLWLLYRLTGREDAAKVIEVWPT